MTLNAQQQAAQRAADLMAKDWHCSEAIFAATGDYYLGKLSEAMIGMSTPFAGGIGCEHHDLCGALTGGLMVIGALHGRADGKVNDDKCQRLAATYRSAFLKKFGSLTCADLNQGNCGELTREACLVLMEVMGKRKSRKAKQ
ncbi:MAG: C-GCAxxG-C-C family protein [Anaerolineaceae bacterium]|nr:C-GCAxxG-C-C family protein [Anaerolineaceae bacterium]